MKTVEEIVEKFAQMDWRLDTFDRREFIRTELTSLLQGLVEEIEKSKDAWPDRANFIVAAKDEDIKIIRQLMVK